MTGLAHPLNALTVDLEDYFHASAFTGLVPLGTWDLQPSRVERSTKKVLELLAQFGLKGTFFVLGWVAKRNPSLVREIQSAGHDLGCHSYAHRPIYAMTSAEFRDDTQRAMATIEDAAGVSVYAYRAPTFSITDRSLWAFEILLELGFTVDSSIFPTRNHLYGISGVPHRPFRVRVEGRDLVEFPLPALKIGSWGMPVTGGAYLRLLPYHFQVAGLNRMASRQEPIILYFHPWELDPDQPRLASAFGSRFYHYTGLNRTEIRLKRLFKAFPFGRLPRSHAADTPVYTVVNTCGGRAALSPLPLS